MDIVRSKYTDLIFHIFAHMKINNASDIYDEAYVENTEKESGIRTVIPEGITEYYCMHFERLAVINFMPYFMVRDTEELLYMLRHTGMTTEEDNNQFIDPFCRIIKELSADYFNYRERRTKAQTKSFEALQTYINEQSIVMGHFFDNLFESENMKLKVIISDSLRRNGRATIAGDTCVVILPMTSERYSMQEVFMQLIHECTHMMTDPLIDSIHMDDGSHELAEYQVLLFDLWLFQRDSKALCSEYIKWISQEMLDNSEKKLPKEQMEKLKQCFERH